jgi:hypothetical protein
MMVQTVSCTVTLGMNEKWLVLTRFETGRT